MSVYSDWNDAFASELEQQVARKGVSLAQAQDAAVLAASLRVLEGEPPVILDVDFEKFWAKISRPLAVLGLVLPLTLGGGCASESVLDVCVESWAQGAEFSEYDRDEDSVKIVLDGETEASTITLVDEHSCEVSVDDGSGAEPEVVAYVEVW